MKTKHIKIDGSFPDGMWQVTELLDKGWSILDKTVLDHRYIMYVLRDVADPDVGKCSNVPN